jgi:hypothetical protein
LRAELGESVPKSDHPGTPTVEPNRLQLIRDRLQHNFYESGPPAEQIATAVSAALKAPSQNSRPH